MKTRSLIPAILFLLVLCASANSAYWEDSVSTLGTIAPNQGAEFGRLLFKFDLPNELDGAVIDYAELIFTATPDTGTSYICLMGVFPVSTSWESANLSWSSGWTNSGGDYVDSIFSTCLIRRSEDKLTRADITDVAQLWADGTLPNYGLIVMPLEDLGRYLKLHESSSLPQGVKAKVRVFYSRKAED